MINGMKNLTSSVYTFENLRKGDFLYVDKTAFLWELVRPSVGIYFLSRPRRFGKSLTLSTLKAVFQGKRELFQGLAIDKEDYDWRPYPVIHLDMGDRKNDTPEALDRSLRVILDENARNLGVTLTEEITQEAFRELIIKASATAPAVVLVDEYDKPILDNVGRPEVEALREALEGFYGVIKATEPRQRFVFITGVAKFTKVSVFSKLNHLTDVTMDGRFAAMLGYTQEELEANFAEHIADAARTQGIERGELLARMRRWYNGYRFEEGAETVYNPVSVARFFSSGGKFDNYWFETGSPGILFKLAKDDGFDFARDLAAPVNSLNFSQFDVGKLQPLPLLVQTGYLTIQGAVDAPRGGRAYQLGFPNYEVESAFETFLLDDYLPGVQPDPALDRMFEALLAEDHEAFVEELNALLGAIPWQLHIKREAYYHTVAFMAMRLVGLPATAEEPVHSGALDSGVAVGDRVYIFEFKLDRSAKEAVAQIRKKNYAAKYAAAAKQGKRVILFGVNFDSAKRQIDGWLAEPV
ncbi:MAG: ATP-binding protein [Acidobacteriota bacterium]|jgi:hypothetical protein|nr:ATP-binding protein [Acidobacteriota bacterium]